MNDHSPFDRRIPRLIGPASIYVTVLLFLTVLPFHGCVQTSPPPSIERSVSVLIALLSDEHAGVRRTAVESLGKIGDETTIVSVIDLTSDPSPLVRAAAAKAAGRLGASVKERIAPSLLQALHDPDDEVRRAAAEALGELEPPSELLSSIPDLLASPDVGIRRTATLALLQVDSTRWVASLYKALGDPDPLIRQRTVAVLGETGVPSVLPSIRERLMQDPDPAVRAEAAYRLWVVSDVKAGAVLKRAAETDADPTVRRWARRGLD